MKNNFIKEIIFSLVLIITLFIIVNPKDFLMPSMVQITIACVVVFLFGFYSSLVLKEKAQDEREVMHRSLAGRNAFLAGSSVILIGVLFGLFKHNIDPWLVFSLVSMILAKIITRVYTEKYR